MLFIGLVLEKEAASTLPAVERTSVLGNARNFLSNRKWMAGFMLTNLMMVPFSLALNLGPLSLVSSLMGAGLVVLALFSHFYLKERLHPHVLAGMALTVAGIALFSGVGAHAVPPPVGWAEVVALVHSLRLPTVLGLLLLGALGPVLLCRALGYRFAAVLFGLASGAASAAGMLLTKLFMAGLDLHALTTRGPFLLLVAALVISANSSSMVLQQVGFQKGKALVLAPVFAVCNVLLPAVCGVVLFHEWRGLDAGEMGWKVGALVGVLAGAALLALGDAEVHGPGLEPVAEPPPAR